MNKNLKAAQTHVKPWQTVIEPGITSQFPHAISQMASRFNTGTDFIVTTLKNTNYQPTAEDVSNFVQSLEWITSQLSDQKAALDKVKTSFETFKTNSDTDYTNLNSGNNSIQKAILDDNKLIIKLQGDIATDNANIAKDNAAITAAGIAAGVGLFVGVAAIGLGAAASGPGAPLAIVIGAFIMVASVAELAAVLAVYIPKLNAARTKLADDTAHLNEEQQQVASLTVMSNSVSKLLDLNKLMQNSLQDLTDWFATATLDIQTVAKDIKEGSTNITKKEWFELWLNIQQAQKDWATLETFANQWATAATTIVNKVIPINKDTGKKSGVA